MEFSILGPVEAVGADGALPLGGPRQRALLAFLLVNANRVVAADRLVDELWVAPPGDAHAALQNQVSRLRKVLGDRLVTKAPGYVLRVEEGELDLDRFRALVAAAGSTKESSERSRLLREADALYRGAPLAEIEAPYAAAEAAALDELRLAALEARVDADLDRGQHAELVPELGSLVGRHPLRERLRGQHILALYRCGRQAEALEAYRSTRHMLDEELGLEPSAALRDLEKAILRHDPTLEHVADEGTLAAASVGARRRRPLLLAGGAVVLAAAGGGAAMLLRDAPATPIAVPVMHHSARPLRHAARRKPHAEAPVNRKQGARKPVAPQLPAVVRERSVTVITFVQSTTAARAQTTALPPETTAPPPQATTRKPKAPANATPTVTTETVASPPSGWRVLSDDFGSSTPNWAMWQPNITGTGATYAQQNGRLELTLDADGTLGGQYNMIQSGYASVCKFDGDFDARIDYTLLQWPVPAGARVQLSAWTLPNPGIDVARGSNQYGEAYDGDLNGSWNVFPTEDSRGTLRVARHSGTLASYYLEKNTWVLLMSGSSSDEVTIGVSLFGDAQDWAHKTVHAAFDNFSIAAPSFTCH